MSDGDPQWTIGIHAVTALLRRHPASVSRVHIQQGRRDARLQAVRDLCREAGLDIEELDRRSMDRQHPGVHQGVAALHTEGGGANDTTDSTGKHPPRSKGKDASRQLDALLDSLLDSPLHDPLLLVLDGVTDPRNLGACLRCADAAGADAVIIPKDRSAPLNDAARKAASGAAETVPLLRVTNLARCLDGLKQRGLWLAGAAEDAATPLYQQDLRGPLALVLGSEGSGLRRLTRQRCDYILSIPMAGGVSSLNVSAAAAVCLFEAVRQRGAVGYSQSLDQAF